MDHSRSHVVVAEGIPVRVLMFLENDCVLLASKMQLRRELMRLRDLLE